MHDDKLCMHDDKLCMDDDKFCMYDGKLCMGHYILGTGDQGPKDLGTWDLGTQISMHCACMYSSHEPW